MVLNVPERFLFHSELQVKMEESRSEESIIVHDATRMEQDAGLMLGGQQRSILAFCGGSVLFGDCSSLLQIEVIDTTN